MGKKQDTIDRLTFELSEARGALTRTSALVRTANDKLDDDKELLERALADAGLILIVDNGSLNHFARFDLVKTPANVEWNASRIQRGTAIDGGTFEIQLSAPRGGGGFVVHGSSS